MKTKMDAAQERIDIAENKTRDRTRGESKIKRK